MFRLRTYFLWQCSYTVSKHFIVRLKNCQRQIWFQNTQGLQNFTNWQHETKRKQKKKTWDTKYYPIQVIQKFHSRRTKYTYTMVCECQAIKKLLDVVTSCHSALFIFTTIRQHEQTANKSLTFRSILFHVYLAKLWTTQIVQCRTIGQLVNNSLARTCNERVAV
jgi:hypothetical protein